MQRREQQLNPASPSLGIAFVLSVSGDLLQQSWLENTSFLPRGYVEKWVHSAPCCHKYNRINMVVISTLTPFSPAQYYIYKGVL